MDSLGTLFIRIFGTFSLYFSRILGAFWYFRHFWDFFQVFGNSQDFCGFPRYLAFSSIFGDFRNLFGDFCFFGIFRIFFRVIWNFQNFSDFRNFCINFSFSLGFLRFYPEFLVFSGIFFWNIRNVQIFGDFCEFPGILEFFDCFPRKFCFQIHTYVYVWKHNILNLVVNIFKATYVIHIMYIISYCKKVMAIFDINNFVIIFLILKVSITFSMMNIPFCMFSFLFSIQRAFRWYTCRGYNWLKYYFRSNLMIYVFTFGNELFWKNRSVTSVFYGLLSTVYCILYL